MIQMYLCYHKELTELSFRVLQNVIAIFYRKHSLRWIQVFLFIFYDSTSSVYHYWDSPPQYLYYILSTNNFTAHQWDNNQMTTSKPRIFIYRQALLFSEHQVHIMSTNDCGWDCVWMWLYYLINWKCEIKMLWHYMKKRDSGFGFTHAHHWNSS